MVGSVAMGVVLAASLVACILYVLVARGRTELLTAARITTHVAIWAQFVAAGTLLYLIFNYRFDINYIYEHVSRSLSKPLLFACFYASQEGSFMLWALLTAIVAIFLIPYAQRQRVEAPVMAVYLGVFGFLALMLVAKSPFTTIYAAHPGDVMAGFIPPDGRGLNPSLENLWIVIHPPMLFTGFTLLAVPFAFAVTGLIRKDFQGWVTTSLPWTLGAGMILGFGIMLGGFWAYETLGWGGYWGWDPVENASLLPWLITVAGTHTMLTQKRTGGLVKTNIGMTLLAYALVLYASFLTRSGVLGDASVHSFADPGYVAFALLLYGMIFFVGGSFALFLWRWRAMNVRGKDYKVLSRETALSIGSALLGASTLVVFIGTSAPLIKKKVDISFYGDLHVPIAILMMLVNGLSLVLKWRQSGWQEMLRKGAWGFGLALLGAIGLYFAGLDDIKFLAIGFSALFSLFINIEVALNLFRGKVGVKMDASAGSMKQKIWSAFKWSFSIGLVALLIFSKGDYYKFGQIIVDDAGGFYWLGFFLIVTAAFMILGAPSFRLDKRFIGAYVAHIGLGLFLLGVIATTRYEKKEFVKLVQGKPVKAFGGKYTLSFDSTEITPPENYYFHVGVHDQAGNVALAKPLWFWTAFNNHTDPIANPGILKYGSKDLYFTVVATDQEGGIPHDSLVRGQAVTILGGKKTVKFVDFDFPPEEMAKMRQQQDFRVKARVEVFEGKDTTSANPVPLEISVTRNLSTGEAHQEDVVVPNTAYHLQLAELRPDLSDRSKSKIIFAWFDKNNPPPKPVPTITVEAFVKPFINAVWGGILIVVLGFYYSVLRRRREALVAIDRAERAYEKSKPQSEGLKDPIASEGARISPVEAPKKLS
ncbi:MAG: cytochrome c biogenesis protein CcsA [Bacteroidetes bacterium]|nr:cytochrome c biogenesis protein CcsA [Bacteroidota bacterium]